MEENTTAVEESGTNETFAQFIKLFKSFLAVLLPFIGLDFLVKYIDEIG